jgi:hypothetical protein
MSEGIRLPLGRLTMLRILAQTFMCSIAAFGVFAQTPAETQKSPREIVVEFWSAETNGERLTTDGWYRASRYFVRPNQPHASKIIHVVRNGPADKIEETATADNWTEISVSTNELGMLDEALRFKPSPERGQGGVLLLKGPIITFNLISTSKYWRLKQDGAREKDRREHRSGKFCGLRIRHGSMLMPLFGL